MKPTWQRLFTMATVTIGHLTFSPVSAAAATITYDFTVSLPPSSAADRYQPRQGYFSYEADLAEATLCLGVPCVSAFEFQFGPWVYGLSDLNQARMLWLSDSDFEFALGGPSSPAEQPAFVLVSPGASSRGGFLIDIPELNLSVMNRGGIAYKRRSTSITSVPEPAMAMGLGLLAVLGYCLQSRRE
ncbi:hypothetical protein C7271_21990 [filamentous cyanobacterium CCP5]|nr:hypothetical protein C7271_21990 [filamentous cyanobacterium CCP5]